MPHPYTTVTRARSRRRRIVAPAAKVRGNGPPARRLVRASRRAYFALYAPHHLLAQVGTRGYWRAQGPRLFAAGLIVLFAFSLYQLFANDVFYVPQLNVEGNRLLPASEIEQAAGIRGWSVFFVSGRDVEAAIMRLPEVKDARVAINMPNVVRVQVDERLPRFLWETSRGSYWVDDDGIALRARFDAPQLLTMKDLDNKATKIGERVNADAFNAAVNLRNLWPDGPREFEWSKAHGLAVRDDHGWLIYFGSASQMADKIAALKIVSAQLVKDQHAIAFIDVGSGLPYYQEVTKRQ